MLSHVGSVNENEDLPMFWIIIHFSKAHVNGTQVVETLQLLSASAKQAMPHHTVITKKILAPRNHASLEYLAMLLILQSLPKMLLLPNTPVDHALQATLEMASSAMVSKSISCNLKTTYFYSVA